MTTFADNPAAVLREAAAVLRLRAERADGTAWQIGRGTCEIARPLESGRSSFVASTYGGLGSEEANADHIAALDPAVSLALADLLDQAAGIATWRKHVGDGPTADLVDRCLTLARTYLRSDR